jgi:hypothetical protein
MPTMTYGTLCVGQCLAAIHSIELPMDDFERKFRNAQEQVKPNVKLEVPNHHAGGNSGASRDWAEPKPLPNGLLPVEAFNTDFMPAALAPWIDDIAMRLQCPPDYVAVSAITAAGALIGRRLGIKPQTKTDWIEIPNLWGAFIGRPGMLKSPAMAEAIKPIHRLEAEAAKDNEIAQQAYEAGMDAYKLRKDVRISLEKMRLKKNSQADVDLALGEQPPRVPTPVRYRTNDSSYGAHAHIRKVRKLFFARRREAW